MLGFEPIWLSSCANDEQLWQVRTFQPGGEELIEFNHIVILLIRPVPWNTTTRLAGEWSHNAGSRLPALLSSQANGKYPWACDIWPLFFWACFTGFSEILQPNCFTKHRWKVRVKEQRQQNGYNLAKLRKKIYAVTTCLSFTEIAQNFLSKETDAPCDRIAPSCHTVYCAR